jgi:hypothetical protein
MKPVLGLAVLLTWFAKCDEHGVQFPHRPHKPHGSAGAAAPDAGEPDEEAGSSAPEAGASGAAAGSAAPIAGQPAAAGNPAPGACKGPAGLYKDSACCELQDGLRPYRPRYELWADGASKDRVIYLPAGTKIDTRKTDRWNFPQGTRIYKTFSLNGLKLETRVLEKTASGAPGVNSWTFAVWQWNAEQNFATKLEGDAFKNGVKDALGTGHDIPSEANCKTCHTQAETSAMGAPALDAVNGFSALQLNHEGAGFTLRELLDSDWLTGDQTGAISVDNANILGDEQAVAALGYLHANCGHCHSTSIRSGFQLWAKIGASECDQPAYAFAVGQCLTGWRGHEISTDPNETQIYLRRVVAGDAAMSGMVARMNARDNPMGDQMPKIGTEIVDAEGVKQVSDWIDSLTIQSCGPYRECLPPPPPTAGAGGAAGSPAARAGAGGS